MFVWLQRAVRKLIRKEGKGQREAEYLGYEAFFTLPGMSRAGVSGEGRRQARMGTRRPERKTA